MALYNKMRPKSFGQMVGQKSAISVLKGIVKTGRIPNALLFIGTRGTGKTTAARVFAKYLNCLQPTEDGPCLVCENCRAVDAGTMDVMELDAASHTGVEDIRKLIESTQYMPSLKRKVYIIDEVHMLSTAAFNALLKTLEEPPHGCFFILCTTEAHKVPVTIKSRCMGVNFTRIEETVIFEQLSQYCEGANVSFEEDALKIIAKAADGGMRDAWTIFERFLSEEKITVDVVMTSLGMLTEESLFGLLAGISRGDASVALDALKDLSCRGKNAEVLMKDILNILTDVIYLHQTGSTKSLLNTESYKEGIEILATDISVANALSFVKELTAVYHGAKASDMDFALEAAILSIITVSEKESDLEQRVNTLEKEVASLKENGITVAKVEHVEKTVLPEREESAFNCLEESDELPLGEVPEEEDFTPSRKVIVVGDMCDTEVNADVKHTDMDEDGFSPMSSEDVKGFDMLEEDMEELDGEIGESISLSLEEEIEDGGQETEKEEETLSLDDGLDAFLFGDFFNIPRQN